MKPVLCLALLTTLVTGSLLAQEKSAISTLTFDPVDEARSRTVPVKVYRAASDSPQPVVLFSHGLGGSRENNVYVANEWASQGFIAVFLQHPGSDESVWRSAEPSQRMEALKKAANLTATLDRFMDVPFVIDQLEAWNAEEGHPLFGAMDLEKIGLSGHSYGAVTTQALMGQRFPLNRSFPDERIDAFLLMSPSDVRGGTSAADAFGHIQAPVLCMTGTKDGSPVQPDLTPESRRKVFEALPDGDKFQIVFEEGNHFAFSDSSRYSKNRIAHHHPAIQTISVQFWNAYLKGDEAAKAWLQSEHPRTDCELVEKDVWEWK